MITMRLSMNGEVPMMAPVAASPERSVRREREQGHGRQNHQRPDPASRRPFESRSAVMPANTSGSSALTWSVGASAVS